MNYVLLAAMGLVGGLLYAYKTDTALVDNALIATGIAADNSNTSSSDETIAARNNNPLNIRATSDKWQGLATPPTRDGFFNFISVEYCYRAAKIIILSSYASRGIVTLSEVISSWAPSFENNTGNYIYFVSNKSGIAKNERITQNNIAKLLYAMTIIESGHAQSMSVIEKGLNL